MNSKQSIHFHTASLGDINKIMMIYDCARAYMRREGNANQWNGGYPSPELIATDIDCGHCYVGTDECGDIVAVFSLIAGEDPTYACIDGEWLNDLPYATIHRLASSGKVKGVLKACVDFCSALHANLRADTHECNRTMLAGLSACGFIRCGIIRIADGSQRIAFQRPCANSQQSVQSRK